MRSSLNTAAAATTVAPLPSSARALRLLPTLGAAVPPMSRCECAGLSFAAIAQRIERGESLDEVSRRTGCGGMCTGCVPDLTAYLAARGLDRR